MLRFSVRTIVPLQKSFVRINSSLSAASTNSVNDILDNTNEKRPKGSIVAAAFASLKEERGENTLSATDSLSEKIIKAKTINGLLSLTENQKNLSRNHALKIVSILAEWSSMNRIKLNEFETDSRFLKVCRILGRTSNQKSNEKNNNSKGISNFRTDDFNMVLGVTGDDEAAKLIASISPLQMVKVISTLAQRKRRSTPLLRSIGYNLSSCSEHLDLKQCADVLYAMALLNYPDSVLSAKLSADIQMQLSKNTDKSAVVGSILTSLGILRYRDIDLLESLSSWILMHYDKTRTQDFSALLLSLGILDYKPNDAEKIKKYACQLTKGDFVKPLDWINHVWTLTLLKFADENSVKSVLSNDFISELTVARFGLTPNLKMKLLNINAYAKLLMKSYKGPLLSEEENSEIFNFPIAYTKGKQILVNGMLDALKSLFAKTSRSAVDSKMGFLIDAVCCFDNKRNPLPLDTQDPNAIKVAIMVIDYHDICHGPNKSLNGIIDLTLTLLEKQNYKVLPIQFNEFNTSDKLLKRVQYLEAKFKEIVNNKN